MARCPILLLLTALLAALAGAGCAVRARTPETPRIDATAGKAPPGFVPERACGEWRSAVGTADPTARRHDAFPELSPTACFVRVEHTDNVAKPGPVPEGCGYDGSPHVVAAVEAARAVHLANTERESSNDVPLALACDLPPDVQRATALHNAATLGMLSTRFEDQRKFPYAAVGTFGFGHRKMRHSKLVDWRPGEACRNLGKDQMDVLDVMRARAGRAAAAYHGGVAPVVIASGSAVHSPLYEAFALAHLLGCQFGVPPDAILLDPCADHTHTNIRNVGGLVVRLGGRTAYLVTDDGLQAHYLQEWNFFHLLNGSIDQRALDDWGFLLGAWRQASAGAVGGFWYTPYRFWDGPRPGIGDLTCLGKN